MGVKTQKEFLVTVRSYWTIFDTIFITIQVWHMFLSIFVGKKLISVIEIAIQGHISSLQVNLTVLKVT